MIFIKLLDTTKGHGYGLWRCENCKKEIRLKIRTGANREVCYQCEQSRKRRTIEAEAFTIKNEDIKERKCLMCCKKFTSTWKGHRRCPACTARLQDTCDNHSFVVYKSQAAGVLY